MLSTQVKHRINMLKQVSHKACHHKLGRMRKVFPVVSQQKCQLPLRKTFYTGTLRIYDLILAKFALPKPISGLKMGPS